MGKSDVVKRRGKACLREGTVADVLALAAAFFGVPVAQLGAVAGRLTFDGAFILYDSFLSGSAGVLRRAATYLRESFSRRDKSAPQKKFSPTFWSTERAVHQACQLARSLRSGLPSLRAEFLLETGEPEDRSPKLRPPAKANTNAVEGVVKKLWEQSLRDRQRSISTETVRTALRGARILDGRDKADIVLRAVEYAHLCFSLSFSIACATCSFSLFNPISFRLIH